MKLLQNPFVVGLWAAISVVIGDFLNAYVINPSEPFSWKVMLIAAGIAAIGFIGKFFTGAANTSIALIGSAITAIVPLLITGHINWALVGATFAIKLLGLRSSGTAKPIDK